MSSHSSNNRQAITDLCAICSSVDYEKAFDPVSTPDQVELLDQTTKHEVLHDYQTLQLQPSCPVCALLLGIIHRNADGYVVNRVSIRAMKIPKILPNWPSISLPRLRLDITYQYRIPPEAVSYLYWQRDDAKLIHPLDTSSVDYNALKTAIQLCKETHLACIKPPSDENPYLKLIDCQTREVFFAKTRACGEYVALSYVWGSSNHGIKHVDILPHNLPATIEDAMQVALGIGIKYLWIDRYCIDQENEKELLHQIALMDAIYRNATITIVAACGNNPSYGLPGIDSRPRLATHPDLKIENIHFFEPPAPWSIEMCIQESRWSQRAWTYQEAVFSRSRLVFTDEELYFDCLQACGFEAFRFSSRVKPRYTGILDGNMLSALPRRYLGRNTKHSDLIEHIATFSNRSLGHPEDVINALSGILNACEVDIGLYHYWGIPVLQNAPEQQRVSCPQWRPVTAFFWGLQWQRTTPPIRRTFGPSWSWAGWEISVNWTESLNTVRTSDFSADPLAKFQIELLDGSVIDWEEYLSHDRIIRQSLASPFVHITALVTQAHIRHGTKKDFFSFAECEAVFEDDQDDHSFFTLKFRADALNPIPQICEAIHLNPPMDLPHNSAFETFAPPVLLIVGEINGKWERVGTASMSNLQFRSGQRNSPLDLDLERIKESYKRMRKVRKTLRVG